MRKKNSVSDFTSERNATLTAHFKRQLATQSRIDLRRAFQGAAEEPAPRFWVSETRAAVVIARLLRGEEVLNDMYKEKKDMYLEILRRVRELHEKHPEITVADLVADVVNQKAPRSYLSWQRAKTIIYNERRSRINYDRRLYTGKQEADTEGRQR